MNVTDIMAVVLAPAMLVSQPIRQVVETGIVFRKLSEHEEARSLRVHWMRRMRLDEEEIAESLQQDPPFSVQEELLQLHALDKLDRITPPSHVLRQFAIKY